MPTTTFHIAGEKVNPNDPAPAAKVDEREPAEDYDILQLESLVRMKLTSFRDKDRMHLRDMISVELIDETWPAHFPTELAE